MKPTDPERPEPAAEAPRRPPSERRAEQPIRDAARQLTTGRWADWKAVGSYGTLGLEVVLSVLFGLFVGRWIDGKLGTGPYLALAGFALGVAAAVRAVVRIAREMRRETANDGWRETETDRPGRFRLDQRISGPTEDDPSHDSDEHDRKEPR